MTNEDFIPFKRRFICQNWGGRKQKMVMRLKKFAKMVNAHKETIIWMFSGECDLPNSVLIKPIEEVSMEYYK